MKTGFLFKLTLMLAILVRIPWLAQGLNAHEAENVETALLPFFRIALHLAEEGTQPPVYPMLLSAFSVFSTQEIWLRLTSVIAGLFLIQWGFRLGSFWSEGTALITAFLLAVSPHLVVVSTDLVHAIWMTLFAAMSLYYFWRWLQTRKPQDAMVGHFSTLLLLYTCQAGLFWLVGLNLAFFGLCQVHRGFFDVFWKRWLANQGLILLLYLPWLFYTPEQILRFPTHSGDTHLTFAMAYPVDLLSQWEPLYWFTAGSGFALLPLLALIWLHSRHLIRLENRVEAARHWTLIVLPLPLLIGPWLIWLSTGIYFNGHDLVFGSLPVILLTAWALDNLWKKATLPTMPKWAGWFLGIILLAGLLGWSFVLTANLQGHQPPAIQPKALPEVERAL